jgi:sec-independent protein translocase protein TatA
MGLSPVHILILVIVAVMVLGGGRISHTMADVAKGIRAFKKGVMEPDDLPE